MKGMFILNGFGVGEFGGGVFLCMGQFYIVEDSVVVLLMGWFSGGVWCLKLICIEGNGRSIIVKVVDECDMCVGCDEEYVYQFLCLYFDDVDVLFVVWRVLGIFEFDFIFGILNIIWIQFD